ncbi:MAG: 2-oxoacid:acceptor oxidoreductase, beta subunit [Candidatus Methanohalarchaeum thermophilum]|uniref:2-oxoacid:acceptor oxidoreductase, beta subunit n=1 Tax=Methanohalarchaeum thermophilum TaxID=1903181 RepID=A0A1Q6DSX4_METT1|nr:MAG: 2-oxoacid:acceptor oxidoreductase, beta subunit [Candidatus Methanohalarchaeum thermophilum]
MDEFDTSATNTWCPGCGNFAILRSFKDVLNNLNKEEVKKEDIAITTGIGCHGKIFDYLDVSGFYSIHGRAAATATGIKIGNPDLEVISFEGDGDAYNEGISHLVHAARRNIDITVLVHDNKIYALTTGQFTPTTPIGYKGKSTPKGNIEPPLNPIEFMIASKASFVARGFAGDRKHLKNLIHKSIKHKGFSIINILQPTVAFQNTWKYFRERVYKLQETKHDPKNKIQAIKKSKENEQKIPIGIFYKKQRKTYQQAINEQTTNKKQNIHKVIENLK